MQLSIPAYKVDRLIVSLVLLLFSFTEISLMQVGKASVTPFHFVILAFAVPIMFTAPASFRVNRNALVLLLYIVLINIIHFSSIRVTSFIYTLVFFLEFILIISLARCLDAFSLKRVFQLIIILYFLNLCITTLLIQTGLYNDTLGIIFKAYYSMRPMGFSSEPSYASFIVTVAFICYNELKYAAERKNSILTLGLYVVTVALTTSSYGFLYVAICIVYILLREANRMPRNFRLLFFAAFTGIIIIAIAYLSTIDSGPIQRLFNVANALLSDAPISEKFDAVNQVDPSAWARLGPTWLLFQDNGLSPGLLFGHGSGASSFFFQEQMVGILIDADREFLDLGIVPAFIYDFGITGFLLLLLMIWHSFRQKKLFMFLFVLFFFNAGINTQIFWYALAIMAITTQLLNNDAAKKILAGEES